jgi:ParB-like chromosome segregation protein Spo0J
LLSRLLRFFICRSPLRRKFVTGAYRTRTPAFSFQYKAGPGRSCPKQIAASIQEFGFNNPILVDTKAGIIAGHGRLLASRKLGLTEMPVIVLDHLSESQKRACIIADNKLAENAGWDDELLRSELAALQEEDFDVSLLGFEDEDMARLLAAQDATEGLTDEDAVPELTENPVSRTGDLRLLGDHRLLVGDSTNHEDVIRLMADDAADLVFKKPTSAKSWSWSFVTIS